MSVIRILGIDPGLRLTGFGVIEKMGEKITYVTSGTIKTASAKKNPVEGEGDREELPARLVEIRKPAAVILGLYGL